MTSVSAGYTHVRKRLPAGEGLELPGVRLKWYDLHREDLEVADEVRKEAREFLRAEIGGITPMGDLGFVVLHRVGGAYLLLVSTWLNDNELWETVYTKGSAGFELLTFEESAKGTYCVWEMGAVLHEQQAWIRYLFSARDAGAAAAYLADRHPGGLI
ncbi:hypothetical protein [Nonomuraea jiangxiensis]|uniref:Uncharacterized protein n=1 Tax=Nonomuraea jiangxiensis TaxID=633440 RepID=A0A1G9JRH5_9ACTN|nr:hypothetical protein [Nonomuraea jiangxiensis]SDL39533.1 hypothetical protein SAMN05421869_125113 [Nonomuraea jiangxiensis]